MQDYRTFAEWADNEGLATIVSVAIEGARRNDPEGFLCLLGLVYQAGVEAGFEAVDHYEYPNGSEEEEPF
jgi:hypothetical protein